jgi:hypothetical protein
VKRELNQKWKDRFERFDKAEPFGVMGYKNPSELKLLDKHSIWGFVFGPFYYLYKGLYKKSLLIFSSMSIYFLILSAFSYLYNFEISNKIYSIPGEVICAMFVNRDLYMLHTRNETVWPQLKVLENWKATAIVAVVSVSSLFCFVFAMEPELNEVMAKNVSGNWGSESDGLFLEMRLQGGAKHLKINDSFYKVKVEKLDVDSVILKNISSPNPANFSFHVAWDSTEESFRLKWIQEKGSDILLDYHQ